VHVARLTGRDEDAELQLPHPVEPLQLATHPLECDKTIAEPAGILEPTRIGQVAQTAPQAWHRRLGPAELVRPEDSCRELRRPARTQRPDRGRPRRRGERGARAPERSYPALAPGPRYGGIPRRSQLADQAELLERPLELRPGHLPLDRVCR